MPNHFNMPDLINSILLLAFYFYIRFVFGIGGGS